jgi:hypothetical protein
LCYTRGCDGEDLSLEEILGPKQEMRELRLENEELQAESGVDEAKSIYQIPTIKQTLQSHRSYNR